MYISPPHYLLETLRPRLELLQFISAYLTSSKKPEKFLHSFFKNHICLWKVVKEILIKI